MVNTILSVLFGILIFCPFIVTILILVIYRRLGTAPAIRTRPSSRFNNAIFISFGIYNCTNDLWGTGWRLYIYHCNYHYYYLFDC